MSTVPTLRVASKDHARRLPELPDEVRLALTEAAASARDGLLAMSVATGLTVMSAMMQAEIANLAGPRGRHDPDRGVVRHGSARSSVTLGARRVAVSRPRARTTDGREVALETFAAFAADDLLGQVVLQRMLAGLACRRFTYEPDIMVAPVDAPEDELVAAPLLVVEVLSPSTRDADLGSKMAEYAAAGAPWHWTLAGPEDRLGISLVVWRNGGAGFVEAQRIQRRPPQQTIAPFAIAIDLQDLFAY